MTRQLIRISILVIFAVGSSFSQNSAGEGLGSVLNSDGSIKSGQNGSFSVSGYKMKLDEAGKPYFTNNTRIGSPTSAINWSNFSNGIGIEGSQISIQINAILVNGSDIYVGGQFESIGSLICKNVAKWDGSSWSRLGSGMNSLVRALAHDGTYLYCGGGFSVAGGISASRIAKWDGTSWSAMGSGLNNYVNCLTIFNSTLYAGGEFTGSGATPLNRIARWNGSGWEGVDNGLNAVVTAMTFSATDLYVAGSFSIVNSIYLIRILKWNHSPG